MGLGSAWAASAPLPFSVHRCKSDDSLARQRMANASDTIYSCNVLPTRIQSTIDYLVDMAQLTVPSLFMPELGGIAACPITTSFMCYKPSNNSKATASNNGAASTNAVQQDSGEPGDTFGFDLPQLYLAGGAAIHRALRPLQQSNSAHISHQVVDETLRLAHNPVVSMAPCPPPEYQPRSEPYSHKASDHAYANQIPTASQYPPEPHNSASPAHLAAAAPASTSNGDSAIDGTTTHVDRLLAVNQYLLRRIRKLEITNQIIKEAYVEVQEILEAERQSKATQLKALERKHDEELNDLYKELTDRNEHRKGSFSISIKSMAESDSESDSDYGFKPGFSTIKGSDSKKKARSSSAEPNAAEAGADADDGIEFVRSSSSSPLLYSGKRALSPFQIQRSVSELAFSSPPLDYHVDSRSTRPNEFEVEFLNVSLENEVQNSSSDSEDENSSAFSDFDACNDPKHIKDKAVDEVDWDTDDEQQQIIIDHDCAGVDIAELTIRHEGCEGEDSGAGLFDAGYSSESDEDADTESDGDNDDESVSSEEMGDLEHQLGTDIVLSESDTHVYKPSAVFNCENYVLDFSDSDSVQSNSRSRSSSPQPHISQSDYAHIDPAKAVLERYYSQKGVLSLAADIDDLPVDEDCKSDQPKSLERDRRGDSSTNANTFASDEFTADSPWGVLGEQEVNAQLESVKKSFDELEMEHNAQLPADQRIAKFIYRASSHLQQGARGGVSLGFMLHNLELLAEKFASNHTSILCAFVESLYQTVEPVCVGSSQGSSDNINAADNATAVKASKEYEHQRQKPRSALAKKLNNEAYSSQQAARRIAKLLHTFIALPEDQQIVLHQLEQLSKANARTRPFKHAMLLRILYECELVDRGSIEQWYLSLKQPELQNSDGSDADYDDDDGNMDPLALQRGQLLRRNATPLLIELSGSSGVSSAACSEVPLDELHLQMQLVGGACSSTVSLSSASSSAASLSISGASGLQSTTPCSHLAGTTTPISEENSTLNSHSSECEFSGMNKGFVGNIGILNLGRRNGSRMLPSAALDPEYSPERPHHHKCTSSAVIAEGSGSMKPAKQFCCSAHSGNGNKGKAIMIRHPAAAISVTHKDVDELATAHRMLLGRIQQGGSNDKTADSETQNASAGTMLKKDKDDDRFSSEREKRQHMSINERLGL
ncbi:hypothetical protein GGI26_001232 [Coemansia sp. RSA 1358]|nr:hypothetical protein GGI26_001232 [Coemansia sp. RSA 1358]